nr:asparagine synthetase [glutamine-hydrolyzing] 1-like [Nerophis lumbriciformis]
MCGIAGYLDLPRQRMADRAVLTRMADVMHHRGPDSSGFFLDGALGFGFRRLSIVDLHTGGQPIFNEDRSMVLMCNGEIYNCQELRQELEARGHRFSTRSDVEVLIHLFEEQGSEMVHRLNGQFGLAIWDRRRQTLFLARDQAGIVPLYYTVQNGQFIFGSEVKVLLEHPDVKPKVDMTGLDQIFSFPGMISPWTMFEGIKRLKNGHYLTVTGEEIEETEYWDLDYPLEEEAEYPHPDEYYIKGLRDLFRQSVKYRLQADVPVGFYLSGGLDSSLTAAVIHELYPDLRRHAFSIAFTDERANEANYQRLMADHVNCELHNTRFDWSRTSELLEKMIYHAECPIKETYNTCSLELSRMAREQDIKVILTGEGADELFAGYVGYRFDQVRQGQEPAEDLEELLEQQMRERLWGDPNLFYEHDYVAFTAQRKALYAPDLRRRFGKFNTLKKPLIDKSRIRGRHVLHKRSYLDYKLRMVDHLLMDHGDQMALANSVEARYPFLDIELMRFAQKIPPWLKLNGMTEKYIVRRIGEQLLPRQILSREKFGWFAPGSPELLQAKVEWIHDVLSCDTIRRQGYFDADVVGELKQRYSEPGFKLNQPYESDLLIVIASFGIFLEVFDMPDAA